MSRKVGEDLGWGFVAEASQPGSIVVVNEGEDEGVSFGMGREAVLAEVGGAVVLGVEGLAEAAMKRSTMPLVWGR